MSENGVKTQNVLQVSVLDDLLGNREGSTARQSVGALATQLNGSGAIADHFEELRDQISSGLLLAATWDEMLTLSGGPDGGAGGVLDADVGTHLQATASGYDGETVANSGSYSWNSTWGRWVRIGSTGLSGKTDQSDFSALRDKVGLAQFEEAYAALSWLRLFYDEDRNILGGWHRDGTFSAMLSLSSQVPFEALNEDARQRMVNGATTREISVESGWLRVFEQVGYGILGGFDTSGKFIADLSDRCIFPESLVVPDQQQWTSGPDICASGDSMTAGAGGGGTNYPSVLASLTGRTVRNLGVGGETSPTIAGRLGALPWLVTVPGDEIPASGGVTVTLEGTDGTNVAPLLQGSAGVNPCAIAGVSGTLSLSGGVYTFTRAEAGDVAAVPYPLPLVPAGNDRLGDILVLWWGQNDGTEDASAIIARQRATIEAVPVAQPRYLVVGLPSGTDANRTAMDLQFVREYGRRFVNIRKYLSSYAAMSAAGITPTAQDDTDIAAGRVPDSLRSDATHFNAAGYTLTAEYVHARMIELGYLET